MSPVLTAALVTHLKTVGSVKRAGKLLTKMDVKVLLSLRWVLSTHIVTRGVPLVTMVHTVPYVSLIMKVVQRYLQGCITPRMGTSIKLIIQ